MRTAAQQLARELSRMHPEDRAIAKAIRKGPFDGIKSLGDLVRRGLMDAHVARLKRATAILALLSLPGCALKLPGTQDPTVEVARIIAAAQTEAIKAITAAMSKADASACAVEGGR